jgi:TolA-binding protein
MNRRFVPACALLVFASAVLPAQDLALSRLAAQCDSQIAWITDGFTSPDLGGPTPIPPGGPDRGALLQSALDRARAERKLVLWYVPRIDGPQVYRSPILDDYLKIVAFTEPRLVDLITARFVPLRMAADLAVGEKTGVRSLDWVEPAFAILSPEGKILRRLDRIRTVSAERLRAVFVAELAKHADLAPPPAETVAALESAGDDPSKLAQAAGRAVVAGWVEGAERAAAKLDALGAKAEAALFRVQCSPDLETALERVAALAAAVETLPADSALRPYARFADAKAALYTGRYADAEREFRTLASARNPSNLRDEALYRLAYAQLRRGKTEVAAATYRQLCQEFPTSPRAYQAATNLLIGRDTTPIGPAFHHFEDVALPTRAEAAWVAGAVDTTRPRPAAEADAVVARALEWLLVRQDGNGQWKDSRYAYWSSPRILPNTWTAVTAIVAASLLDWRELDPKRVDSALAKAERALFDPQLMDRGQNEEIYADGFRALYLVKRLGRPGLDAKAGAQAKQRLDEIVKQISRQQDDAGFFGHEYPNPFTTGATLVALDRARAAGAVTGDAVFAEGAKALRAVRNEEGAFAYGKGRAPRKGEAGLKNSVARSPVCEHALLVSGAGSTDALTKSFENWDRFLPRLEKVRVCDFHSDEELAGFFFWHAVYFASEAARALPAEAREARLAALRDLSLRTVEVDGSFIDSHEMGKSYATGMALLTLKNVLPQKIQ